MCLCHWTVANLRLWEKSLALYFGSGKSEQNFWFICLYKEGLWPQDKNNLANAAWRSWIGKSEESSRQIESSKIEQGAVILLTVNSHQLCCLLRDLQFSIDIRISQTAPIRFRVLEFQSVPVEYLFNFEGGHSNILRHSQCLILFLPLTVFDLTYLNVSLSIHYFCFKVERIIINNFKSIAWELFG